MQHNLYLPSALWFSQTVWVPKCSGEVCKFLHSCARHSLLSPSISALFCLVNSEVWPSPHCPSELFLEAFPNRCYLVSLLMVILEALCLTDILPP